MKPVNLYDFDHTVYAGDSTVDFWLFCLRRDLRLLRYLPGQVWHGLLFALGREDRTAFKSHFFVFLRALRDIPGLAELFWDGHYSKLKDWYLEADHKRDVIISASPEFLLQPAAQRLGILKLIATNVNLGTGAIIGRNCRGPEKIARFNQELPGVAIEKAYSDHKSDLPLLRLAKAAYLVKGNVVTPLPQPLKQT
jgi:phosphatidylglycerophosphatase C